MGTGTSGGPLFTERAIPLHCYDWGVRTHVFDIYERNPGHGIETWESYPTSGFHRMVAQGRLLPHTRYSRTYQALTKSKEVVSFRSDDGNWGCEHAGGMVNDVFVGSPNLSGAPSSQALLQQAASNFMSKAQFDAGTFLAELSKARSLFTGVATAFANATQRGVLNAGTVEDLLNVWLSVRYAMRPLASDFESFNAALASSQKKKVKKIFTSAKAQSSWEFSQDGEKRSLNHAQFIQNEEQMVYTGSVKKIASISGELNPTRVLFDPARTAWEYVPYSWMFDWLMNVGNWIDSVRLSESGIAYTASVTTIVSYDAKLRWSATLAPGWGGSWEREYEMKYFSLERVPVEDVPIENVPLNINMSTAKCIDLLAVLYQPICNHARKRWGYVPFAHPYDSTDLRIR